MTPISLKFGDRKDKGKIVASINPQVPAEIPQSASRAVDLDYHIPPGGIYDTLQKTEKFRYMYMDPDTIRLAESERITRMGHLLQKRIQDEQNAVTSQAKKEEDEKMVDEEA